MTSLVASGAAREPRASGTLDWQAFSAARFPARRRHDLEALTAYGAYRRAHADGEGERGPAVQTVDGARPQKRSTALVDWEDEGGAPR